ncbi:hypothetical protein BDW22DRAFT_248227 [Trametopsis cervina]|nr:hypothetical protein BDW22DRAFT_248227 [Trametopsis cervina]
MSALVLADGRHGGTYRIEGIGDSERRRERGRTERERRAKGEITEGTSGNEREREGTGRERERRAQGDVNNSRTGQHAAHQPTRNAHKRAPLAAVQTSTPLAQPPSKVLVSRHSLSCLPTSRPTSGVAVHATAQPSSQPRPSDSLAVGSCGGRLSLLSMCRKGGGRDCERADV